MSRIGIRDMVKEWGAVRAVDGISFEVAGGSLTVLLGPSGCGKSTILRLIAGLEAADAGSVAIGGREVTGSDPAERGVSMVFQSYALFPHLTVRENILFGLKVRRVAAAERRERLQDAARMVGLEALLGRKPSQLSGGQRQRVALARAIVSRRPVCLMDEPLSNLDAKLRAEMRDEIRTLQRRLGLTMIYVTHDQVEAMTMADQVVLLDQGRIVQAGSPRELYTRPASVFAARFIGAPPMNILPLDRLAATDLLPENRPAAVRNAEGWQAGVRPEEIRITDSGVPGTVAAVDYLGAETLLRLTLDDPAMNDRPLFTKTDGTCRYQPGDRVRVSWPRDAIHLFDAAGIRRDAADAAPASPPNPTSD